MAGGHEVRSESVSTDISQLWILLTLGALAALVLASSNYYTWLWRKGKNLPPGPRNWPLVGAIPYMCSSMHKAFERFAKQYGPIVYLRLGYSDVVLVSSAESAEELLKTKDAEFCDRAGSTLNRTAAKYLGFQSSLFVFSDYNARLKMLRKVSISEYFTAAKLKTYEDLRGQEMAVMVEKMWSVAENNCNHSGDTENSKWGPVSVIIGNAASEAVQNILFKLCLGMRFDDLPPKDDLRKFPEIAQEFMELFMRFNLVDFLPFLERLDPQGLMKVFKKCGERQKQLYEKILEQKKQARELVNRDMRKASASDGESYVSHFVDVLLDLQEEDPNLSDNSIMAAVMTILVAGIDTSSTAVEWAFLELVHNPHHLRRLQEELDTTVGKDRRIEESDLKVMPFLNAVIMESLRLHPVAAFSGPHSNKAPSTLGGYYIPARTAVIVDIYSHGRDPKVWKDPLQFIPERFMSRPQSSSATEDLSEDMSNIKVNGTDFRLLPFSSGRRMCLGHTLGHVLVSRIVATLAHAFDWSPAPGSENFKGSEDLNASLVVHPARGCVMCPRPRLGRQVYTGRYLSTPSRAWPSFKCTHTV